jgi:thioredoxin 1
MKKIVSLLLIAFFAVNITVQANPNPVKKGAVAGIQFTEGSWKSILDKAKKEKKMIFLDAYASWCGPCKMLQKKIFTQQAVGDYFNANFINVKIDMEVGEGPALSQRYPLDAYPTLFIIDGNGKLVSKAVGALEANDLIAFGKSVAKKK